MLLGLYTDFSGRRGKVAWYWPTLSEALAYFIEAEVDVFLCDQTNVGNSISGSSAFSKPSLYIWKFLIQALLKPHLKDFEHHFTGMQNRHNCMVWTFNGIALLWDWNENWLICLVATAEFSKFADILSVAHQETHLFASQVVSKSLLRTKISKTKR